ncbi:MAG: hypothetical protein N2444_04045 [Methylocystis sp.]|nr:hypothetical protein [Methylocystis sp.]
MTSNTAKFRSPFNKRSRRRAARGSDDPSAVFKTFVHVLAKLRAEARNAQSGAATLSEKH